MRVVWFCCWQTRCIHEWAWWGRDQCLEVIFRRKTNYRWWARRQAYGWQRLASLNEWVNTTTCSYHPPGAAQRSTLKEGKWDNVRINRSRYSQWTQKGDLQHVGILQKFVGSIELNKLKGRTSAIAWISIRMPTLRNTNQTPLQDGKIYLFWGAVSVKHQRSKGGRRKNKPVLSGLHLLPHFYN